MAQKLKFRRGDLIVIAAVLLLALLVAAMFLPQTRGAQVEIYRDGQLIKALPLSKNGSFTVDGQYQNTVTVQNGAVSISSSNCPGQDCVHCGKISRPGRSIVCLPNRVEVRISGSGEVDIISG